jgi:HEPN domain-containing protein
MGEFLRDPSDWLRRLSPDEWIRAGLGELRRAQESFDRGDSRAGTVGVKRAAGMALNAALLVEPKESWGRTYVDHVGAVAADQEVPEAVRSACRTLLEAAGPSPGVVHLRTPRADERVLEAARDVIAHAWAVVKKHERANG